jgi:polyisoprenoid-binding protein YceI
MKDDKLKGRDFFNAKDSPFISFKSTKVAQTGPNTFDLEGDFTIRGVTRKEKLTLIDNGKGSTSGSIEGRMAFEVPVGPGGVYQRWNRVNKEFDIQARGSRS